MLIARARIAEALDPLLYDTPTANPGPWCGWCPVSRWCTAVNLDEDGSWIEPESSEPGVRTSLLAFAETAGYDEDDDIPF